MKTPTDEQLNLAMCEWVGWQIEPWNSPGLRGERLINPQGLIVNSRLAESWRIPNYLSDDSPRRLLNEAEARLTKEQRATYAERLTYAIRDQETIGFYHERWALITLPARQRVIAILQVVKPELFTK